MAGGKETPRQKMIGMMYLVLLALLALQVSAAVMQKFIFLDQALKARTIQGEAANDKIVERIASSVKDRGNKPEELALLKGASEITKLTHKIVDDYLEKEIRQAFVKSGGGWKEGLENIEPVGAKNTESGNQFFIGAKKNKKGYELEKKLTEFEKQLISITNKYSKGVKLKLDKLAIGGKDHPIFSKDPEQKKKDFAELNFGDSPMVAILATISELESRIVAAEEKALNILAGQVGAGDFKFDEIVAMYRANANTLAVGTKYEVEMFISATSSSIKPRMTFNGAEVKDISPKGIGKYTVGASTAGGARQADGTFKKSWKGEIAIKHPVTNKDTVFPVKGEYFVVQPVIQVQSGAVNTLYKDCANKLTIQVPQLGASYNPAFGVSGGGYKKGRKKGEIYVMPTQPKVSISVRSGSTPCGNVKFGVRLPPRPDIVLKKSNGRAADEKRGERAGALRSINLVADCSDNTFKTNLPQDSKYFVTKAEIMLVRGKRPVGRMNTKGGRVNLSRLGEQRPGDRIMVEIKSVARKNYRGKLVPVSIPTTIKNIPLID